MPDPFPVTDDMVAWAKVNAQGVDLDWETDQLVDWARGKGETKKDWVATWRTWMRRKAKESMPARSRSEFAPGGAQWQMANPAWYRDAEGEWQTGQ